MPSTAFLMSLGRSQPLLLATISPMFVDILYFRDEVLDKDYLQEEEGLLHSSSW